MYTGGRGIAPTGPVSYNSPVEFEWDATKARSNLAKHGVSFDEAVEAFGDPLATTYADPDHSHDEVRYLTLARTTRQRLLVISHADCGPDCVRIIGARLATKKEAHDYHEKT